MEYPSIIRNIENQLKKIQRRGRRYLNIQVLSKDRLKELNLGLENIFPLPEMKSLQDQNRMTPSELLTEQIAAKDFSEQPPRSSSSANYDSSLPSGNLETKVPLNVEELQNISWNNEEMTGITSFNQPTFGSMDELRSAHKDCMNCSLSAGRNRLVFGSGSPKASLIFIGEGPGAEEDAQGEPFVGRAGKLLSKMIHSIGIDRKDVYITNVVKCRPPENRTPKPPEVASCMSILENQLKLVAPKLIVTLGNVPTRALMPDIQGITKVRGYPLQFRGWTLLPTFHPSYLLRNRSAMNLAWKDFRSIEKLVFNTS